MFSKLGKIGGRVNCMYSRNAVLSKVLLQFHKHILLKETRILLLISRYICCQILGDSINLPSRMSEVFVSLLSKFPKLRFMILDRPTYGTVSRWKEEYMLLGKQDTARCNCQRQRYIEITFDKELVQISYIRCTP